MQTIVDYRTVKMAEDNARERQIMDFIGEYSEFNRYLLSFLNEKTKITGINCLINGLIVNKQSGMACDDDILDRLLTINDYRSKLCFNKVLWVNENIFPNYIKMIKFVRKWAEENIDLVGELINKGRNTYSPQ